MLEGLVATLLNRFLGMYIQNFDPKQLNIGIWSGDVKLRDLELRKDALDQLKLPINVIEGHLGNLSLQIPWSNLKNKPVRVDIQDVFILVAPRADQEYDEEEEIRRRVRVKLEKLQNAELLKERVSAGMTEEEQNKNQSFVESLVTKIVDNLQIKVQNIHIRYEDALSTPGHPFSVGFTLEEFSAVSTNENWEPHFIQGHVEATHKLVKLGSLAVYWNTDSDHFSSDLGGSHGEMLQAFKRLISTGDMNQDEHQFILKPVNGVGKLRLDKTGKHDHPAIKANMEFDEIGFVVDEDQYRDALMLVDLFHFYIRHQQFKKYKPKGVTPKEDPRAWLSFATTAVLSRIHEKNRKWSWDYFRERRDDRKKYIELFVKKRKNELLSPEETKEYDALEAKLSYEDLRFYRSLGRNQLRKERALTKAKEPPKQPEKQGWVAWMWGSATTQKKDTADDSTVITEEQKKELFEAIEWDEQQELREAIDIPKDTVKMLVESTLRTGSFTLRRDPHGKKSDVLSILFETFKASFMARPESFLADLSLGQLKIFDGTTEGTLYPQIVRLKDSRITEVDNEEEKEEVEPGDMTDDEGGDGATTAYTDAKEVSQDDEDEEEPFFQASFEKNPLDGSADSAFTAKMRSMEIIYNPRFVEGAYKFFKPPERHMESINALMESASATVEEFRQQTRAGLEFALEEHKTLNAMLDLQAPLIIIPESVTKEDTQCLVLDVGHIRVTSDLVKKEDIEAVQSKQSKKYTEEDYEQLENLMYDKFKLQFHSTQVLIGPSVSETLAQLREKTDSKHLHIVDRINVDFQAQISILPKAPNLTRFKVSGHLPSLQVSISDRKYKTLMKLIDVAIPNFDDVDEGEHVERVPEHHRRESVAKKLELDTQRPHFMGHHEIDLDEGSVTSETETFVEAEEGGISDVAKRIMQRNFELRFTVDKLQGSLYQAATEGNDETKLVEIVAKHFELLFYIREFDMAADVVLNSLSVDDFISTEMPTELRTIITSLENLEKPTNNEMPLFQVNYLRIKPNSPEFTTKYEEIDQHVNVKMSTLSLVVTPKTLLTLLNFILATFTNPEGPPAAALIDAPREDYESDIEEIVPQNNGKIKVDIDMASVRLILNHDGIRLATLTVDNADCKVLVMGNKLDVGGHIGKFSLTDDIDRGAIDEAELLQLVKVEGENLAEFKYQTFVPDDPEYPGYDTSIFLRSESIKVFFVEEPFRKLFNFAIKFGRMQALFNSARQAALNQAQQIQQGAGKMHFDVLLATPIVVFPRPGDVAPEFAKRDVISAYPGEVYAHNRFETIPEAPDAPVNHIDAGIRNIRMTSTLHYEDYESEDLEILDKVDLTVSIRMIDHDGSLRQPNMEVKSNMSDIKVRLTQCQYAFMLQLVNTIPGVFTIDEVDDEDVVDELPLSERAKSNLKDSEESLPSQTDSGESSLHPELHSPAKTWTYMDVVFDIGTVGIDLHISEPKKPVTDLAASSLSTAYLTNVKLKLKGLNNGAMESEVLVDSFNMRDTRRAGSNKFRKVVWSTNTDGYQIMASMRRTGGAKQDSIILVTVDSPTLLFSLDYLFTLQKYVMAPFNAETTGIEELDAEPSEEDGGSTTTMHSANTRQSHVVTQPRKEPEPTSTLAFRVNIVDAQVILIADPSQSNTEAILLRTKQVVFAQQNALTLEISKVGMFLCRMDAFEESRLRLLDDFSISGSLSSKNTKKQSITNADIQVDPLVLRVSLRDILLAMQIVNKALEMTNAEPQSQKEPPKKLKEIIGGEDASLKKRTASGRPASSRPGARSRKSSAATRLTDKAKAQMVSGVVNREQLSVGIDGIRVVLIGDQHELPLIDMSVKRFEIHLSDWSGAMKAETDIETFVNVYNFSKSAWEPLLEPWQLGLHASRENNNEKLAIDIYSRKIMDLSVSSQTIALFSRASQFIQRNEDMLTKPRRVDAPYIIKNQTGYAIDVWAVGKNNGSDAMAASLEDGKECPWRFEMWEKMRENLSPEGASGIVGIKLKDSPFETIQRIPVTREGETLYLLKLPDGTVVNTLLCDVHLAENNIKNIVFRSPLLVENNTAIPVELGILDNRQKRIVHTYKIQPGESQPAPIEMAWSHSLVVRPDPGFKYGWSVQSLHWKEVIDHPTGRILCRSTETNNEAPFIFQMHVRTHTGKSAHPRIRIGLFAPVEIENLLPFDFKFRVYDKKTGKDWTMFLRKGGSSPVHVVELSSLISLSVIPQETPYGASEFAIINSPNTEYSQENTLQLRNRLRGGPILNLKLHYFPIPDGGGAFRVSVYAPYIVLNKTGLDVSIRQVRGGTDALYLKGIPIDSSEAPDTKLSPYMFSFHNDDNKNRAALQVGDSDWSKPQSFEAIGSASEVVLSTKGKRSEVHVGVSVDEGKGKYKHSKIVTLAPRYVIRNKMDEDLLIRQVESDDFYAIKPGELLPLHSLVLSKHKQLCLCFPGAKNRWTSPFSISDLGSIHLKIAKAGESQQLLKVEILAEKATIFLNIKREERSWPYSIRNESDMEFTFYQTNPINEWDDDEDNDIPYYRPIRYRLPERSIMPYAWDYPAAKRKELTIMCGRTERTIKMTEIGNMIPFKVPVEGGRRTKIIDINVIADGPTQTLVLSNYQPSKSIYKPKDNFSRSSLDLAGKEGFEITDQDSGTTFSLKFQLAGIGISLINKQPKELAYITLRDLEFLYNESSLYQIFKVLVKWVQIDNQLYGGIFPIILYPSVVPKTGKEMDVHPSFHASVTRVKDDSYGLIYIKFATMLLQQLTIELDEDFIFALLDFTNIPGASWTEPEEDVLFDDSAAMPQPTAEQGGQEVYFEFFNIQPAQLDLSFMRTEVINADNKWTARNPITFLLNVLTMAVGNVNDAPIKFNALMLENARVSLPVLSEHIQKHYSQAFIYQIHKVLGSADFLGNPVGLFNNISSGVYDIFYEPYQGFTMTDRPQDLGIGIAKGATSFVKKSVFGVSDSLSKFTGSISKGLSAATLDKNFQDRRRMSRNRNRPKHALYGVTAGAQSFATSVASGALGLAKRPIEGATQEGPVGFLKGIGKGVIGLTTKPVIGVFDLASNVTEGIRNTTTVFDQEGLERVRLTRYIGRDGVVRPYSQREALGQFWLKQLDNGKHFNEEYVAHLELQEQDVVIIVTYTRIMLIKAKRLYCEWDIPLRDIRTISKEKTGITLVLRNRQGPFIPIRDREQLEFLFGKISHVVHSFNSVTPS